MRKAIKVTSGNISLVTSQISFWDNAELRIQELAQDIEWNTEDGVTTYVVLRDTIGYEGKAVLLDLLIEEEFVDRFPNANVDDSELKDI
jgi:hypothetical protein